MTDIGQGSTTANWIVLRITLSETCTAYHLGRLLDDVDMLYSRLVAIDRYGEVLSTRVPPNPVSWVLYARRSLEREQRLEVLQAGPGSRFCLNLLAKASSVGNWLKGQLPRLLQYSPEQLRELGDLEIKAKRHEVAAKGHEAAAKRVGVKREEQEVVRAALQNAHTMLDLADKAGRLADRSEAERVLRAVLDPVEGLARLKEEGFLVDAEIIEMDEPAAREASRQLPSPKTEEEKGVASSDEPTEGGQS